MSATYPTTHVCRSRACSLSDVFRQFPAKHIARWGDASPRTAERWRAGSVAPSGPVLLRMLRASPELRAALLDDEIQLRGVSRC